MTGSLVVNCDAVTDNTHLREQKRGLYLDGELGGLALGARDGIVVEWEVKAVMDRNLLWIDFILVVAD